MATSNLNFRIDENLKNEAKVIIDGYGLSFTQLFKMLLNQVVKTGEIPLSLSYNSTKGYRADVEKELLEQFAAARSNDNENVCKSTEDLIKWVQS
ncbi:MULTISPECIES: type II toxin-antitoxin system RelB/DinJ family antitoxin [unclassified Lonepinella]|uniref:type II toxin-antitoxin system RelB/DinJ family antitoxin n=1 Tax=unclassified Lonepinella TaxID=2642006 RepID=UPI003F6E0709